MASHLTMSLPEFLFGALIMLVLAACAVRSVIREYRREGERRAMMAATAPLELPDPLDDQFAALERQVAQREGRGGVVMYHINVHDNRIIEPLGASVSIPFNTTIPGGYYLGADGVPHDANGNAIETVCSREGHRFPERFLYGVPPVFGRCTRCGADHA